jgi:hypothetical protein
MNGKTTHIKKIGITCDDYKAKKFRKGLLKAGFILEYDGICEIKGVHLFRIEVEAKDYADMLEKVGKIIRKLELEFKHPN